MSISPLSLSYAAPETSSFSSRRQDFTRLGNALQSGNLEAAQQFYVRLEQLLRGSQSTKPITSEFAALGQALSSGDLDQAQAAFTQLKTGIQKPGIQAPKQSESSGGQSAVQGQQPQKPILPDGGYIGLTPFQIPVPNHSPDGSSNPAGGSVNLVG
jgi:hypothetical protein